jgi:hypothetical protein
VLDGHPCPSPRSASPPFGLLKSRLAVTGLSRAYKQEQEQEQERIVFNRY